MLRAEPWESPSTLHDMQQQIKTLHDENKQQWYGRPQQPPGVPPLWLGFYNPSAEPPNECPDTCEADCIDLQIPAIHLDGAPATVACAYRIIVADMCSVPSYNPLADLPSNPGWKIQTGGGAGTGCCDWWLRIWLDGAAYATFIDYDAPYDRITNPVGSPCLGAWTRRGWSSPGPGYPTAPDITATAASCGDPPPTPTPTDTGTETGSGTATPDCGSPQSFEWSTGPFPARGWYPLTYTCTCSGLPPARDGAYQGEVADGTCE